jgi:hypothetical protein
MSQLDPLLFNQYDLSTVLRGHEQKMLQAIEAIESDRLLNTSTDDWCDYFEQEYKVDAPVLYEDRIAVDQTEAKVDVSRDPLRSIFDRSQPFYVTGTSIKFFIPFEGDAELFKCQPSTYSLNPPRATVSRNEIVLTYTRTDHDAAAVKSQFERDLSSIRDYISWITRDVTPFNAAVRSKARGHLESRRQKFLNDRGLIASLGFPLRQRANVSQTFAAPEVKRKVVPPKPTPGDLPFVPEPTLSMDEYEHILSIVSNMAQVLERSPEAFRRMKEEDLRQHFLVQLNGHYEGQATGETFNFDGKTDILIRVNGKNIFIAECKFWRGPESLRDTVDQLLGYATWRDTKTAILLFNRKKNFSAVLASFPEVVAAHPNFKRKVDFKSETGFRFILHHRDDPNRELILTVLAFEVPA